jgi:endonuclease YncB( thermonuclease family)
MSLRTSFPKHFQLILLLFLAGIAALPFTSFSFAREPIRTVNGTVTKVSDGDTIHVTTPEQTKLTVRLHGIDAPETPKINQRTGHINKLLNLVNPRQNGTKTHESRTRNARKSHESSHLYSVSS